MIENIIAENEDGKSKKEEDDIILQNLVENYYEE